MVNPLIIGIVIHPDNVEILGTPAEFRAKPAGDHVPRLELSLPIGFGGWRVLWVVGIDGNVNDRLAVADASAGINFAHSLGRGDRSAYELSLKLRASPLAERVQEARVAATPGHKRDLVYRRDIDRAARLLEY